MTNLGMTTALVVLAMTCTGWRAHAVSVTFGVPHATKLSTAFLDPGVAGSSADTPSGMGLSSSNRTIGQTFSLPRPAIIDRIWIGLTVPQQNVSYDLEIWALVGPPTSPPFPPASGTQQGPSVLCTHGSPISHVAGEWAIYDIPDISLAPGDYAIMLEDLTTPPAFNHLTWAVIPSSFDNIPGRVAFLNQTAASGERDGCMALEGWVVPEPVSACLVTLPILAWLLRRRG